MTLEVIVFLLENWLATEFTMRLALVVLVLISPLAEGGQ